MQTIKIKKLNEAAVIPVWNNKSAGCDLSSLESYVLKPGERKLFKTGLSIAIPPRREIHYVDDKGNVTRREILSEGLYGRIAPRSGLAFKSGIDVMAGVIDEDYRGEIGVILINLGQEDKSIAAGDKIAQLIFENYNRCDFAVVDTLDDTNRGTGGYGSTDKKTTPPTVTPLPKKVDPVFRLGNKTRIEKCVPVSLQEQARFKLSRCDGEFYEYSENGNYGICVVDSSGQVLDKFFWE